MTAYDAVLFDLDGVLTDTAALHAACWKRTFDEVLDEPFDAERDYLAHVDGKPRHAGVRDMLRARGVEPGDGMVDAIADRKQALVERALAEEGVEAFPGSVALEETTAVRTPARRSRRTSATEPGNASTPSSASARSTSACLRSAIASTMPSPGSTPRARSMSRTPAWRGLPSTWAR